MVTPRRARTYEADGLQLDAAVEGHVDEQLLVVLVAARRVTITRTLAQTHLDGSYFQPGIEGNGVRAS